MIIVLTEIVDWLLRESGGGGVACIGKVFKYFLFEDRQGYKVLIISTRMTHFDRPKDTPEPKSLLRMLINGSRNVLK